MYMNIICIIGIYIGAAIMVYSLYRYYRTLVHMKNQAYERKPFGNWVHVACFAMILFFIAGYFMTGLFMIRSPYTSVNGLLLAIFFFGAWFVFFMVRSMGQMSENIAQKTFEIVQAMINAMETKDRYTKGHSVHVMHLVNLLYEALPPEKKKTIDVVKLRDAALLHDIGKIAIPDQILNKPGRLDKEEMNVIRMHPKYGTEVLVNTSYEKLSEWVLYHHERMDGRGYYGLPPEQIPLEARMLAVADTFSAVYTDRVYHKALSYEKAIGILRGAAGTQLDEELVEAFCTIEQSEIERVSLVAKVRTFHTEQ